MLLKPLFVVVIPAQLIALLLCARRLRAQLFLHLGISLLSFIAWIQSRARNISPVEIGTAENPIKSVISSQKNFRNQDYSIPKIPIDATLPTIISEVNAQITKFQNVPVIILLITLFIAFFYADFKLNLFLSSILIGALVTQIYGGGYGTNLRTLNIFLAFSLMMVGSILNRVETKS
jgi:hypothetical protein